MSRVLRCAAGATVKRTWQDKAPTQVIAIRALMDDYQPHENRELLALSTRFSARLYEAHRATEPMHYERLVDERDTSRVLYRKTDDTKKCSICSGAPRLSLRAQLRIAEAKIQALQERLAELERRRR